MDKGKPPLEGFAKRSGGRLKETRRGSLLVLIGVHHIDAVSLETFALLDALGFRDAIRTQTLEDVRRKMFQFFYVIRAATLDQTFTVNLPEAPNYEHIMKGDRVCKLHQFSDTLLLRAHAETEADVEALVNATRQVVAIGAVQGVLLRGVLSHGELAVEEEMSLYLGKGLVDAYDLEHEQDWSGCVVNDSFANQWANLTTRLQDGGTLVSYPAPMKSGAVQKRLCVNWASKVVGDLQDILIGPAGIPRAGVEWDAFRKMRNTLDFYDAHRPE